jgi:hypothetical protein
MPPPTSPDGKNSLSQKQSCRSCISFVKLSSLSQHLKVRCSITLVKSLFQSPALRDSQPSPFFTNTCTMGSISSPSKLKPLADTELFKPVQIGALKLSHRIVQAPLTRMRGTKESDGVWAPGDINVEYYGQRANKGGFQLTEATNISRLVDFQPWRN